MKFEIKVPMLSLGSGAYGDKSDMKDEDEGAQVEKRKAKSIKEQQPSKDDMRKDMHESAVHDEMRMSARKWVAGEISTKQHKETVKRGKMALKHGPMMTETN